MMYSEFVKGTNCKQNDHNYHVFEILEAIYRDNEEITKAQVYAMAQPLLDNSPSESELRAERELQESIDEMKERLAELEEMIESHLYWARRYREWAKEEINLEKKGYYREQSKSDFSMARYYKGEQRRLKVAILCLEN